MAAGRGNVASSTLADDEKGSVRHPGATFRVETKTILLECSTDTFPTLLEKEPSKTGRGRAMARDSQ